MALPDDLGYLQAGARGACVDLSPYSGDAARHRPDVSWSSANGAHRARALSMHSSTAAWSPALTEYRLGLRTPSPQLSFHDLSPSSKLTCKSPWLVVFLSWRTVSREVISLLLCREVWKGPVLVQRVSRAQSSIVSFETLNRPLSFPLPEIPLWGSFCAGRLGKRIYE
jgi:hypothetical protein